MNAVAIVGGGPVGMALALALQRQGLRAEIFEARTRAAVRQDARVLALSEGARLLLDELGVWPQTAATAIETIHISHQGRFGRTCLRADELGLASLGWVVAARDLIDSLDSAIQTAAIDYHENSKIDVDAVGVFDAKTYALTAWAEGQIPLDAGHARDFEQQAIVCNVHTAAPHRHIAWERFTADGPMALLPCGDAYSLVLVCANAQAATVLALDDAGFLHVLQQRFGSRHRFTAASPRYAFPLSLRYRSQPVGARQVWLGNAAQTLHPVAGQGFNLALRDVWELAHCLGQAHSQGAPLGDISTLSVYAEGRRVDRWGAMSFTSLLVDLFGNDAPLLSQARGAGLLALDMIPALRSFVAKRMIYGARGGL